VRASYIIENVVLKNKQEKIPLIRMYSYNKNPFWPVPLTLFRHRWNRIICVYLGFFILSYIPLWQGYFIPQQLIV